MKRTRRFITYVCPRCWQNVYIDDITPEDKSKPLPPDEIVEYTCDKCSRKPKREKRCDR